MPRSRSAFKNRCKQQAELMETGHLETFIDQTLETTDDAWRKMLAVHLDGAFFCTRAALPIMIEQQSGCIINMGSIMGTSGGNAPPGYCAAKGAVLALTRAQARELAPRGIRVNAIAPGWIDTDMTAPLGELREVIRLQTPLMRFGAPDDIAWAAVYLASEEAGFVTGQVISPNGGWHMSAVARPRNQRPTCGQQ